MSWGDLVKTNLIGTGKVSKGAIIGFDGTVWGISDDFKITEAEAQAAVKGFANRDGLLASGIKLEGDKYFVLQADEDRIIGKKESKGFFMYKTGQTVIISTYKEGIQPEQCSTATGALADYFKGIGY